MNTMDILEHCILASVMLACGPRVAGRSRIPPTPPMEEGHAVTAPARDFYGLGRMAMCAVADWSATARGQDLAGR